MRMAGEAAPAVFSGFFEHGHLARFVRRLRTMALDALPDHVGTVLLVDGVVAIAMEDDDRDACRRHGLSGRGQIRTVAHGRQGAHRIGRAAVREARVAADGGEQVGIRAPHDDGHGAARGQAGDRDARGVDRVPRDDRAGQAGDQGRFAFVAFVVRLIEPVPAAVPAHLRRLFRIQDQALRLLGQFVHAGAACEIGGILAAAVQHHHQRQGRIRLAARDIQFIIDRTRFALESPGHELTLAGRGSADSGGRVGTCEQVGPRVEAKVWPVSCC